MWRQRMRNRKGIGNRELSRLRSSLKRVLGMPDYQGYLDHAARCHPDRPALTEREFYQRHLAARYGGGGLRCC